MARLSKPAVDEKLFDDAIDKNGNIINVRKLINISVYSIKCQLY